LDAQHKIWSIDIKFDKKTQKFGRTTPNLVERHKIWSKNTKFGRTTQNLIEKHQIWSNDIKFDRKTQNLVKKHQIRSNDTKFGQTTQNLVVRQKLMGFNFGWMAHIQSHDDTKFLFRANRPLAKSG
jgi:hypothetical protein